MSFLGRFSPGVAYRDLRHFLVTREPYEFIFLALAIAITGTLMFVFMRDSRVELPYHRNIIYVQNWRLDRSDAQIKAQQVIDEAARKKRLAAEEAERAKLRAQFKRLDDSMTKMGL
jgi:hypothetical protein